MSTTVSIGLVGVSIHTTDAPARARLVECLRVGHVHRRPREPGELEHLRDDAEGSPVGVVAQDDVAVRRQGPQDRVLRRHARREREPVVAHPRARRRHVSSAARVGLPVLPVLEAGMSPDRGLGERRGERDRRHHGAGDRVGWLTGMDRTGLEPVGVPDLGVGHRHFGCPVVGAPSGGTPSCPFVQERQEVRPAEHADRMAPVEHEERRSGFEGLDQSCDRLPDAHHRQPRPHDLRHRPSSTPASANVRSISASSDTVPTTSFSASGGSVSTDTITCETPCPRIARPPGDPSPRG